jgi:GAF domain-containing protein
LAREDLLARTFVQLADAWVDDGDLGHVSQMVIHRCIELFSTSAAGILLSDADGHLRVAASSSQQMQRAQLYELRVGEGPCIDCYRTGLHVRLAAGFRSVNAVPVRVRDQVIGSLNLFGTEVGTLNDPDLLAAQALAQATAFTILRQRLTAAAAVDGQFRLVGDDQLVVEQAKGVLAGRAGIGIDEARQRIERYAHHHGLELAAVCQEIVAGTLSLLTFPETHAQRHHRG